MCTASSAAHVKACRLLGSKPFTDTWWRIIIWTPRPRQCKIVPTFRLIWPFCLAIVLTLFGWKNIGSSTVFHFLCHNHNMLRITDRLCVATSCQVVSPLSGIITGMLSSFCSVRFADLQDKSWLTHRRLNKMAATVHAKFSNAFFLMNSYVFCFKFRWSLFLMLQLIISRYWFGKWLGTIKTTTWPCAN